MTEKETSGWKIAERYFGNVTGLDPEAEWLLGTSENDGEAITYFLPRTLGGDSETGIKRESGPDETVPFPFVISPEPGGDNGEEILDLLRSLAIPDDNDLANKKDEAAEEKPFFFIVDEDAEILKDNGIAGALCNRAYFNKAVETPKFQKLAKAMRLSTALRKQAIPQPEQFKKKSPEWLGEALKKAFETSPKTKDPRPVVVGVIDDSFAIGHPRFQFSDGSSRIFSYWDQEADYNTTKDRSLVTFGRELLNFNPAALDPTKNWPHLPALNEMLNDASVVKRPPAEFYRTTELRPFFPSGAAPAQRLRSHGTHVLDLAAGAPKKDIKGMPSEQLADDAPALVLVKLPRSSVAETSGAFLEFFLLEGVRHIIRRAKMMHHDAKVVIVSSYGFYGGPHDGASQIERALDQIVAESDNSVEIVLPSGNGRVARSHTKRAFSGPDFTQEINWQVHPEDATPTVMEIWSEPYQGTSDAMMELSIVTPDGTDSKAQGVALKDDQISAQIQLVKDGEVLAIAVCVHSVLHPERRLFLIWMRPTFMPMPTVEPGNPNPAPVPAPAGIWTIRLQALQQERTQPASVWIRRDDSLVGFSSGGRQSLIEQDNIWKDNPNFNQERREEVGDDGTAQRSGTISKIGTGSYTVIVGGFDAGEGDQFPAPSSAGGPTAQRPDETWPKRVGPDALAPSEMFGNIGLAAAGFFGGGKVRFRGTSVSAPLVASEIAKVINTKAFDGGRQFAREQAALSEQELPARAEPSPALGGGGRYITDQMRHRGMPFEHAEK